MLTKIHKTVRRRKIFINRKKRITASPLIFKIHYAPQIISFKIPDIWNFLVLSIKSHKMIYMFSDVYFFKIHLRTHFNFFYLNPISNIFSIYHRFRSTYSKLYWYWVRLVSTSFYSMFYKKIKFKGKGYHVFKNLRNTIVFRFNYAHKLMIYAPWISIKFLSKTSLFFFGINLFDINYSTLEFKTLRPINLFTMKGVRFSKQIIYKKTGKVPN